MKKIAILGSTGSIGTQTLDVVRANGDIEVLGISAGRNIAKLEEQVREFSPQLVAVWDEECSQRSGTEDPGYRYEGSVRYGRTFGTGSNAGDGNPCYRDRGNAWDPSYDRGDPCR